MALMAKSDNKRSWLGMILGLVLLFLILFPLGTSMFFSVGENQTALIYRFGELQSVKQSGVHMKLPFGIDRASIINTGLVYSISFPVSQEWAVPVINSDNGASFTEFRIDYTISDPVSWYTFSFSERPDLVLYSAVKQICLDILINSPGITDESFKASLSEMSDNNQFISSLGIQIEDIIVEDIRSFSDFSNNSLGSLYRNMVNNSLTSRINELKENYIYSFSNNSLNERALKRIEEEGFPWE